MIYFIFKRMYFIVNKTVLLRLFVMKSELLPGFNFLHMKFRQFQI